MLFLCARAMSNQREYQQHISFGRNQFVMHAWSTKKPIISEIYIVEE